VTIVGSPAFEEEEMLAAELVEASLAIEEELDSIDPA